MKRISQSLTHKIIAVCAFVCLLCGCSSDETVVPAVNAEDLPMQSMPARFSVKVCQFDTNGLDTRADNWSWQNGTVVYLQFHNGKSVVRGYADYDSSSKVWTVQSWAGSLGTEDVCEVYFFDGASTSDKKSVTLNPTMGVYADTNGTYSVDSDGEVLIEANLVPLTSRVCFSGANGLSMSLGGVTTYSGYDADANRLTTSTAAVSCSVAADGYTPFVYCNPTNATSREITITNSVDGSNVWFLKSFPSSAFRIGESGLITIPTEDTNRGWEVTGPPSLTLGSTSLSFTKASATKTVSISSNREWTATTTASWLTLSPTSGKNSGTLSVSAAAYTGTDERTATITITAGTLTNTVSVSQGDNLTFTVMGNGKTVTFKMIKVDGGKFQMGSTAGNSNETPAHSVTISKSYYMCESEVTQALWYAVMGQAPIQWNNTYGLGDNYPAYWISYEDCQSFLSALNTKLSSQLGSGEQFRFPTEAEWEFAAKGGNKSIGYTYSGSNTIGDVAWYYNNSGNTAHEVKTKSPNELGLYDMSGNVLEWCYDWYGTYSSSTQTDPTGATSGSYRVYRGGNWKSGYSDCRVVYRNGNSPDNRVNDYLGLRLAL